MTHYFVYKTTNLENDKYYIGVHSTDNIDDGYLGSGTLIKRAIKKYGRDSFSREILKYFDTNDDAYKYEAKLVNEDLVNDKMCYNMRCGGEGANSGKNNPMYGRKGINNPNFGRKHDDYTIKKISQGNRGKVYSDDVKKKMSQSKIGRKHDDEFKEKCRKRMLGNNYSLGYKHDDETKKKISEASKNRIISEKTRDKISKLHKGKVVSEESKNKMSESHKNKPILTCPHCGKESKSKGNLTRWHFDNCKKK